MGLYGGAARGMRGLANFGIIVDGLRKSKASSLFFGLFEAKGVNCLGVWLIVACMSVCHVSDYTVSELYENAPNLTD